MAVSPGNGEALKLAALAIPLYVGGMLKLTVSDPSLVVATVGSLDRRVALELLVSLAMRLSCTAAAVSLYSKEMPKLLAETAAAGNLQAGDWFRDDMLAC